MHEKIFEIAAYALSVSETERGLLDTMVSAAEAELTARLRDDVTAEDCGSIYVIAAALLAAADMLLLRSADEVEQFTAGEVSIRQSREMTTAAATDLRQQAERLMAPFCSDDGFAFLGVPG